MTRTRLRPVVLALVAMFLRLWSCSIALLLALGVFVVPAAATPANQAATWVRGTPTFNPENVLMTRNMGGGQTYNWSEPTLGGPLTVTYDGPKPLHLVTTVSWTMPPASFVEGTGAPLTLTDAAQSPAKSYGGIDINANWGWANGFTASVPGRGDTAVCAGGCGQTNTSNTTITLPFGLTSDPSHPENDPTLWITVDGHTVFYVRYTRAAAPAPTPTSAPVTRPGSDAPVVTPPRIIDNPVPGPDAPAVTPPSMASGCGTASPLQQMSPADRAAYSQVILVLDQSYNKLGLTSDEFGCLAVGNSCLTGAMQTPQSSPGDGLLGRDTLDGLVSIANLLGGAQGTILTQLTEQADQNAKYKAMFEAINKLYELVASSNPDTALLWKLAKMFKANVPSTFKADITKEIDNYKFNELYYGSSDGSVKGYVYYRDLWGNPGDAIAHMYEDGGMATAGTLGQDWQSARTFYDQLNTKAAAGLPASDVDNLTGDFLEEKYLQNTGGTLAPGLLPVNIPSDALENHLRLVLTGGQDQINQFLRDWLSNNTSCFAAPSSGNSGHVGGALAGRIGLADTAQAHVSGRPVSDR